MRKKCKVRIGFFALLFLSSVALCSPHYFPSLVCSVLIHELGHVAVARLRGIELSELRLGIFGASLSPAGALFSYADEIYLCLGGPIANFITAALALAPLGGHLNIFILSSVALGTLNLLPVSGLDGGRIAHSLLCLWASPSTARAVVKCLSFAILFSVWCASLYLLLRAAASLSLFVFSVSAFAKIFLPETV